MQRFKDFTKKSGKVASAILSAAMVTSMVAGTNVVYAATETTEATTDVTAKTTIQNDQEAVRAAKADLEAALADLPVTAALSAEEVAVDTGTALKDFAQPVKEIEEQYTDSAKVLKISNGTIDIKQPTLTQTGTLTLTFNVERTNSGEDVDAKITYTLASRQDRQAAANAAIKAALAEYTEEDLSNVTKKADIAKAANGKKGLGAKGGKYNSIPLFADFNEAEASIKTKDLALKTTKGLIEADVTANQIQLTDFTGNDTLNGDGTADAAYIYSEKIPSNQERMDKAAKDVADFLANDARYLDANLNDDDATLKNKAQNGAGANITTNLTKEQKFEAGIKAYLASKYQDVVLDESEIKAGEPITKFEVSNPATQNADGQATARYGLVTTSVNFSNEKGEPVRDTYLEKEFATDVKSNVSLTLASDYTKTTKAMNDLQTAAALVNHPEDINGVDDYNAAFIEALNLVLAPYNQGNKFDTNTLVDDGTGNTFAVPVTGGAITAVQYDGTTDIDYTNIPVGKEDKYCPIRLKNFDKVYSDFLENNTDVVKADAIPSATVEFISKDASAGKDGVPEVNFTVTSSTAKFLGLAKNAQAESYSKTFTYKEESAQTVVDKAREAVQKALDTMTVTNDTTDADVRKLVEDTIKDYAGVSIKTLTFDKDNATANKEGTAKIVVELTDAKNGITKTASSDKTFKFRSNCFVEENGAKFYYDKDGNKLQNTWLQGTDSPDGYTYYIQNDGSVMQDRLTYHPDGEHVIYFDKDGHEVFDAFVNVKKDVQGQDVDYIGYFDTFGYAYVNKTTYGNGEGAYAKDALFYINDYGVLENKGWFKNAAGEIGYAATNGTLTTSQWSLDQFGRKVYFQANGFLAKGLMTDGVKYYQLDENDGHLVGEF